MKISKLFNEEYVNTASYSTIRALGSYIDGFKNSTRKVVYTVIDKNIQKSTRVDAISNQIMEHTKYLHGSIEGVVVGLARNYTGSPFPLLKDKGYFGKRLNTSPSASRYIETFSHENLTKLFKKEDNVNLISQSFDGKNIEPRFFVPELPVMLLRGSEGTATGFAQKILPRDIKEIVRYINNKKCDLKPSWEGFQGNVSVGEKPNQWIVEGVYEKVNTTTVVVTELPITYSLEQYNKTLNKLQEQNKIQSFKDLSNPKTDLFKFEVKFRRDVLSKVNDLIDYLKLRTTITENFTCIDENNKIIIFENVNELLDAYINIKKIYNEKRKESSLKSMSEDLLVLKNKIKFITDINDEVLDIRNKSKKELSPLLCEFDKVDNNYDYLLNMSLYSLTNEKVKELEKKLNTMQKEYDKLFNQDTTKEWLKNINKI